MSYSVAITTFNRRFDLFKSLLKKIKEQREDLEVIVFINGLTNLPFDEDYRKNILEFISQYKNTFPVVFPEFRSLTRLWNNACRMTSNDYVLIIADDVDVEDTFFDDFDNSYEQLNGHCTYINGHFGGLFLNKHIVEELNWFDERYLGIGHEDGTFLRAYQRKFGHPMPILHVSSIKNDYSLEWQQELLKTEVRLDGQRLDNQFTRFSRFNEEVQEFINSGQEVYGVSYTKQYPYDKFFWEHKDKL